MSNNIKSIKEKHKNAYKLWTEKEDEILKLLFFRYCNFDKMIKIFKRTEGAIRSRIIKLELKEKRTQINLLISKVR